MKKKRRSLAKLGLADIKVFKIANRRGYAAVARNNLTEGRSIPMAYARLVKACRRRGYELPEKAPSKLSNL